MLCGYNEGSLENWVFDFSFYDPEICLFCVHPRCDFLWYEIFVFQDSVWLVKTSWCVNYSSIHQFYWVSDHRGSGFVLWWIFVRHKKCHKLVVSTSFWSWLLNVSSVLTSLKITATHFWVDIALWVGWKFMWTLCFWFWSLCFWNMSFLCSYLMRFFVVLFFSFSRTVWQVKTSWCVKYCSIHRLY